MKKLNQRISLNWFQLTQWSYSVCLTLVLTFLLGSATFAQTNKGISRHGAAFLNISPNARQVAMGNAFTGLANDISVLRYNIGGLGSLPTAMGGINFHNWIDDTQQGSIAGILPTPLGVLGLDFHYFNEGSIQEIDENFARTGQKIESNDIALTLGYGRYFKIMNYELSVGAGVRTIRQSLADQIAQAVSLDVGAVFYTNYLSLGISVQNLGINKFEFISKKETLPETYRGGLALRIPDGELLDIHLATDIAYTIGQSMRYYSGAEVILANLFAIRGGYKFHDWEASRWSTGFGLLIPMDWLAGSETRLDYAYSPLADFDASAHRFSLVFSFGALRRKQMAELYDERRLTRLIYEEKKIERMNEKLKQELEAVEKARKAAEEAQRAAEEAEKRTRDLENELKKRLEQILEIAKTSQGKIEVVPKDETKIQVTMRINFDFDSAVIRTEEFETMQKVAKILNTYPESKVFIAGHTDYIGTEEYNIRLSERRVRSVIAFLTERESVSYDRFYMPIGYGEMKPIASNATDAGRFRNRRVDFMLYTQGAKPEMPEGSAIRDIVAIGDSTVHIICNGKVNFTHHYLSNPERLVIDFPNIFLLFDLKVFELNRGPFISARVAFHPDERYSRVVIDVRYPIQYSIESIENYVKIRILK